jgi:[ribosomal protein S18]-alanine N-acetyltransferase
MSKAYAADIVTWRYAAPYDCYNMTGADPAFFADPASGFFALIDEGTLIGFRSFGADGQVPGGGYDTSALDTGGGLHPELTGKGLGRNAITTGLDFGRRQFAPAAFRVTIGTFNARAQRVVISLGFRSISRFQASTDGRSYEILIRPETAADAAPG